MARRKGILGELTGRRMHCIAIVLSLAFAAAPARAGDEVDYSAPYVTVENGELVTRYPANKHDGTEGSGESMAAPGEQAMRSWLRVPGVPAIIAAALVIVVAAIARRRAAARRAARRSG